jgi:hypothetical protein
MRGQSSDLDTWIAIFGSTASFGACADHFVSERRKPTSRARRRINGSSSLL